MAAADSTRRATVLALLLWATPAVAAPPSPLPASSPPAATQPAASRPAASPPAASRAPVSPPPSDAQVIVDPEDRGPVAASQPAGRPPVTAARSGPRGFTFHGYLRSSFALDTKHEGRRAAVRNDPRPVEDVMDWRSQAYFRATFRLGPRLRAVASGWLDHVGNCERPDQPGEEYWVFNGSACRWAVEPTLGETYVEASLPRVDLRAGLQVVPWGANELLGPADVINPRDLRQAAGFVDPETARLPVPAVRLTVYPASSLLLEGLWVPFFVPHRLDLFGSDYAVLGPAAPTRCGTGLCPFDPRAAERALADAVDPSLRSRLQPLLVQSRFRDASLGNGAAGARVVWRPAGFDLALAYYYGLEQYPTASLDPAAGALLARLFAAPGADGQAAAHELVDRLLAGQPVYESTFRRFHLAALSAMRPFGPVVLKLDAAWSPRRTLYQRDEVTGSLGAVDSGVFSFAAGADYTRGDTLLLSLEVYGLRPLVDGARRASLLYVADAGLYGLIGLAEWRLLRGDLGLRLYGFCDLGHPGYILGPEVSYRVRDWLTLRLGGSFFGGEDLSLPGTLRYNDQVHVGVKGAW